MAATKLKSWKDINDEIWYTLIRSCEGIIDSDLTMSPMTTFKVKSFEEYTKEEALNISRAYFKKWVYLLKEEVLFERNIELAKDLKKFYDCDYGYYFTVQEIKNNVIIHLLDIELADINETINKIRDTFNKGPSELELIFIPKSNMKNFQKYLNEIMKSEMKKIRKKHKAFLKEQHKLIHNNIDSAIERVISKYKY